MAQINPQQINQGPPFWGGPGRLVPSRETDTPTGGGRECSPCRNRLIKIQLKIDRPGGPMPRGAEPHPAEQAPSVPMAPAAI